MSDKLLHSRRKHGTPRIVKLSETTAAIERARYLFDQLFEKHCADADGLVRFVHSGRVSDPWKRSINRLWTAYFAGPRNRGRRDRETDRRVARMWLLDNIDEWIRFDHERAPRARLRERTPDGVLPRTGPLVERTVLAEFGRFFPDLVPRPTPAGPLRKVVQKWRQRVSPPWEEIEGLILAWGLGAQTAASLKREWRTWRKQNRAEGRQRPSRS